MRLDRAAAMAGLTRSEAKKAVIAGRVTVDGAVVRDPAAQADPCRVQVDGAAVRSPGEIYIMLNKPAGVITATEDGRLPTVVDLIPPELRRRGPGPVGRLDRDVTGLVLLTTDGHLAHRLISPKWKAEKRYRARCEGRLTEADAKAFAAGILLSDFTARPAKLEILEAGDGFSLADVTLTEGKFHQVKRMFAAVGHPLAALCRLQIGPLTLDEALAPGEWRMLTDEEIKALKTQCKMSEERESEE